MTPPPTGPAAVRIGTRSSPMALRQAERAAALLGAAHPRRAFTPAPMTAHGDRHAGPLADLGGKGAWVRELDAALAEGRIDTSVSCAKDLPSVHDRAPGIAIGAVLERDDARDALVLPARAGGRRVDELPPGTRIGTGAPRRMAQLREHHPDLVPVPLRGNLNSRLARLDDGSAGVDALLVAYAGLERIGRAGRAAQILDPTVWLPAAGAGILVLEHRDGDRATRDLLAAIGHAPTATVLTAERATLAVLHGDCSTAASVHAHHHDGQLTVHAAVFADDGHRTLRAHSTGPRDQAETVGAEAGRELLAMGARGLLEPHGH